MTGHLDELVAIVRRHHETGAYAGHIIRVHQDALDAIRASASTLATSPPWAPPITAMFGLDLAPDETLPPGGWALIQVGYAEEPPPAWIRRVETVVQEGTITPQGGGQ